MNKLNPNALYTLNQMVINIVLDEATRKQDDLSPKWLETYIYNINQSLQIALSTTEKNENPEANDEETKKLVSQIKNVLKVEKNKKQSEVLKKMENKDLQTESKNLSTIEEIMQKLKQEYSDSIFLILDISKEDLLELYKHRRKLDTYIEKRMPKRLKEELKPIKNLNEEEFNNILQKTMDSINEMSFQTGYGIDTVINLLKISEETIEIEENADILLEYSESYQSKINEKVKIEATKKESEKTEEKSEEDKNLKSKNELEDENLKEKQKKENTIIKSDTKNSREFEEYLKKISQIHMAKENILPVFLHIYSREKGKLFDFFPKEKMQYFYKILDRYEKQTNKKGKIFLFTNKGKQDLQKMIKEVQEFESQIGRKRLEGGISKYGTYFLNTDENEVLMSKMSEANREKGIKVIESITDKEFIEKYLDRKEKDFISFKFPEKYGKTITLRTYNLIRKKLLQRKNQVEVLGYVDGKIGIDVILSSQAKAKDRIAEYCKTKFYVEPNYGVSVSPNKFDEIIKRFEEKIDEREK